MKALTYPAIGHVDFVEISDPVAGPGEVVLKVRASGICHTDLEILKGNYGQGAFPLVPGHEYAGEVVEIGPEVSGIALGDRVAVDPNIECGNCRACGKGNAHLCEALGAYGVTRHGGFSEYSVVRASALHPVGDMSYAMAALAEPVGCVLNGIDAVGVRGGEEALVFGAGPIGLLMAIALKTRGVHDIAMVDLDEARLGLAESFGFRALAADGSELDTARQGVDLAIDATGVPAVAEALIGYVANGGKALFFGVCPSGARITLSPFEIFRRQITLAGSHSLNHNIPQALEVIRSYGPAIERVVSHRLGLDEIAPVLSGASLPGSLKVHAVWPAGGGA